MADARAVQEAVDKNYEAFRELLPELLKSHPGKFALMRDGEVVEFFDTARDAMIFGRREFPDGLLSVQEVTGETMDLGFFSHAVHHGPV